MPFKNCPNCGKLNSVKLTVCPKCNCKINDAPATPPMSYGSPYYMQGQAVPPAQTPMGGMIPPSQPVAAPVAPPPVQPSPFGAPQPSPFGARPANPYAPQQPVQQPSQPSYGASNPYVQPAPAFCPSCGKAIIPGAKFCGFCGKSLSQQPATPAADPAQPTQSPFPQKKNPYIR